MLCVCGALIAYGVSLIPSSSNTPTSDRQELVDSPTEEAFVDSSDTSNLGWEFDDFQLDKLEDELDLLLRDTANVPFAELRQPSE